MINSASSVGHKWILTATDYFTGWEEAVPLKNATEAEILNFLEELVSRFGPLKTIILDNAKVFLGLRVTQFALDHGIYLNTSSNYHP